MAVVSAVGATASYRSRFRAEFFLASFDCLYRGAVYRATGFILCMDLRETLATNFRRLRNARRLPQDELAYEAKIRRGYLRQLEKGNFHASIKIIGKLA